MRESFSIAVSFWIRVWSTFACSKAVRSQTSNNMESWKAEQRSWAWRWKAEKTSRVRRKKIPLRESQQKEDQQTQNVRKVARCSVFSNEKIARRCQKKAHFDTTLWRETHVKLSFRKFGRRCSQKHICKPKCTKHTILEPLLEVQMSKHGMPL